MSQSQPNSTKLFRTSLRDWQADFKARKSAQEDSLPQVPVESESEADSPVRVKRLVARKRRKVKNATTSGH